MDGFFAYEYTPAARLLVTGDDAMSFLQSQFSNDLRPFEEGQCVYGLWLDVKGRVVADSWVLCESAGRFQIISEHGSAELIAAKLARHLIADDVEIKELERPCAFALVGDDVDKWLGKCPEAGNFLKMDSHLVFRGRRSAGSCYELICEPASAAKEMRALLKEASVAFVGKGRLQLERMEAGIPEVPFEIGPSDLPGEGGFDQDAVSFNKGCYLGQEIVARMHHVGQARRALYLVEGEGAVLECPTPLANCDGKSVGELRTAVSMGRGWQGVALLKRRYVTLNEVISIRDRKVRLVRIFRK